MKLKKTPLIIWLLFSGLCLFEVYLVLKGVGGIQALILLSVYTGVLKIAFDISVVDDNSQ